MNFIAVAEFDLGTLQMTGAPTVSGTALVFSAESVEEALAAVDDDWRSSLPSADFWQQEAPDATWYGAFAVQERGILTSPPVSEGEGAALVIEGKRYPGRILNETGGEQVAEFERYLIAGMGDVPEPPPNQARSV